jgi:hypothetical protein
VNKNQRGFGLFEVICYLIIIFAISFIGYTVATHRFVKTSKASKNSSQSQYSAANDFVPYTYSSGQLNGSKFKLLYYPNSKEAKAPLSPTQISLISPALSGDRLPLGMYINQTALPYTGLAAGQPKDCLINDKTGFNEFAFSTKVAGAGSSANVCTIARVAPSGNPTIYMANFSDDKYNYQVYFTQIYDIKAPPEGKFNLIPYNSDIKIILNSIAVQ